MVLIELPGTGEGRAKREKSETRHFPLGRTGNLWDYDFAEADTASLEVSTGSRDRQRAPGDRDSQHRQD